MEFKRGRAALQRRVNRADFPWALAPAALGCFILRPRVKDFFISDCVSHENKIITSNFVVVTKQIKPKKTGEPYLALTLGDRSGQLEAKMWDNVEEVLDGFEQDDFLKIKGLINKYKQRFQLTIHKLRKLALTFDPVELFHKDLSAIRTAQQ